MLKVISFFVLAMSLSLNARADVGACKKDVESLCSDAKKSPVAMQKCMSENKDKLSSECKVQAEKIKEAVTDIHEACKEDVTKFCGDVEKGGRKMMKCMRQHKDELSQGCKDQVAKMKETWKKSK